jgi:hypothetical protein
MRKELPATILPWLKERLAEPNHRRRLSHPVTRNNRITNVQGLLDTLEKCVEAEKDISLQDVLDEVGQRSFGPLLLLAGLVMAAPGIGDIPGVPTGVGMFVLMIAGQMLLQRRHFWLPQWMLKRAVSDKHLCKAIGWVRTPAHNIDRLLKPRLLWLTKRPGSYLIALTCVLIALVTPTMELVLFSANVAGLALMLFGLAVVAHDGILALFAYALTVAVAAPIGYYLL